MTYLNDKRVWVGLAAKGRAIDARPALSRVVRAVLDPARVSCVALAVSSPALAQATDGSADRTDWTAQKCALYESAVKDAITLQGLEGLRMEFLTQNQVFIDNGCVERVEICPMTDEEWKLADLLTKMTMNEGMASTFVPFNCP